MSNQCLTKKRYPSIDVLKLICAFLVINIHAAFPGTFGVYTKTLSRIAVPIFFMISGFFYSSNHSDKYILRQIKKLLTYFILANVLYFVWYIFFDLLQGDDPLVRIKQYVSPLSLIKLLLFHESPIAIHLWYLCASAVVYCILLVAKKLRILSQLLRFWPVLLVINLVGGIYSPLIFGVQIPPTVVRSCYFLGLPFFLMGSFFRTNLESITKRITQGGLLFLIAFSILFTIIEKYLLVRFCSDPEGDVYIGTILLAISVFLCFATNQHTNAAIGKLATLGRLFSFRIYLLHIIAVNLLHYFSGRYAAGELLDSLRPLFVLALTAVFIALLQPLQNLVIKGRKNAAA